MKLSILFLSGLVAISQIHPARAELASTDQFLPAKQGATFVGSSLAGAVLGGPLGLVGGALVGAWYGEKLEEAGQLEQASTQLADTRAKLEDAREHQLVLREELQIARDTSMQYAQLVVDQLELEMMFRTGAAELSEGGRQRLHSLAAFLSNNPQISVRLDGYADPRGGDEFNQDLSLARVSYVAKALQARGVSIDRIATYSHGSHRSTAKEGDLDAYALERVVTIQLQQQPGVASR